MQKELNKIQTMSLLSYYLGEIETMDSVAYYDGSLLETISELEKIYHNNFVPVYKTIINSYSKDFLDEIDYDYLCKRFINGFFKKKFENNKEHIQYIISYFEKKSKTDNKIWKTFEIENKDGSTLTAFAINKKGKIIRKKENLEYHDSDEDYLFDSFGVLERLQLKEKEVNNIENDKVTEYWITFKNSGDFITEDKEKAQEKFEKTDKENINQFFRKQWIKGDLDYQEGFVKVYYG